MVRTRREHARCDLILPISTRTVGWSPLARPDRHWCGFREVGIVLSLANRDPELLTGGGREDAAALALWQRGRGCEPPSGTEDLLAPTIARTDTIEHPGSRNLREALQVEERAQSVSSEMHIAVENQDTQRVREALTSISAEQRTALELRYWEGLSPVEIGERTALPLESVNKRLQLALLKLGDLLSED